MGLTRPRAAQIYDIDYKQAVRVVTTTNITLSGSAPASVDGVSLSLNDRILVTGQTTGSQNGIYYVTTVGTGSNGTWARSTDTNETGELLAGTIVMVTEGSVYADTQWKLTTNDPIVIGTTALTFAQNYSANSISAGTSNVVVGSSSNVTVSVAGTSNVLTVTSTGSNVTGYVTATGNITGNYILGNGALLTGVITSVANINNGTSNITVVSSGGNITAGVGGTANVVVWATTGQYVTGVASATGNVSGGNLTTAGILSVTGNANVGNLGTAGLITATGNITGGNLTTAGNVQGAYILGNGSQLTGLNVSTNTISNGNSNVNIGTSAGNVTISVNGVANNSVFSPGAVTVNGALSGLHTYPKTFSANAIVPANSSVVVVSPFTLSSGYTITIPDSSTMYVWTPT